MSSLSLAGVSKSFGSETALTDLSFSVADGEFFVVLGPSRSGKSTLLRLVAGLERVSSGRILFGEQEVTHLRPAERDVGMFFQNVALYPNKTGRENIAAPLRAHRFGSAEVARRVEEVAALLGVSHILDRTPETFSGGERQRVAIGRAIARRAALHLFDEPLSNLDALVRLRLRTEFKRLQRDLGITTLFVTPDQIEALALADRVMVLDRGRVAQIGTPEEVYRRPASAFVASFIGSPAMNVLAGTLDRRGGGAVFRGEEGGCIRVDGHLHAAGQPVLFGVRPEHLRLDPTAGGATIAAVESLGRRSLARLELGTAECRVLLPADTWARERQTAALSCDAAAVHLFAVDSGARVGTEHARVGTEHSPGRGGARPPTPRGVDPRSGDVVQE